MIIWIISALWKGVPLSSDGKVRLRDGRTGEYVRQAELRSVTCTI